MMNVCGGKLCQNLKKLVIEDSIKGVELDFFLVKSLTSK